MEKVIATYGLTAEQFAAVEESTPADYEVHNTNNITDFIVTDAICYIVGACTLDEHSVFLLQNYFIETSDYANEKVVWVGDVPSNRIFSCYCSIEELTTDMDSILWQAQQHYEIQSMFCGEYAVLSARLIAESLEQDVNKILYIKYGEKPDPLILGRMRREWTALLEVDAVSELAAVYELTLWLRKMKYPYWISGSASSGFIPYILEITRVNPLPHHLSGYNLVWQEFCSYGRVPCYEIHLPRGCQPRMMEWLCNHWLSKLNHYEWKATQPYEPDHLVRGNMHFYFDAEKTVDPVIPTLCREDVFYYLKKHGFIEKDAFRGMCSVRKGRGFPVITVITEEMQTAEDSWFLEYCKMIEWLPSRAQLLEQKLFVAQHQKTQDGAKSSHQ